jgi:hypothetical protein
MRTLAAATAASLCALAVAGCAQAPAPMAAPTAAAAGASRGQCFHAGQVSGFSSVSDNIVDVKVGANRFYRLQMSGSCPNSNFSQRVALRTIGGGSWICRGLDAEIIVPDPMGGQRCLITDVTPISKDVYRATR